MESPNEQKNTSPLLRLSQLINTIRSSGGRAYRSTIQIINRESQHSPNSDCQSTPRSGKSPTNSVDCEETVVKELFKTNHEQGKSETHDDEITLVKQRYKSSDESKTNRSKETMSGDGKSPPKNSGDCEETVVNELFETWSPEQDESDQHGEEITIDDEITLVKKRINSSCSDKSRDSLIDTPRSSGIKSGKSNQSAQTTNDLDLQRLLMENKDLQISLKDLLSQTKELKDENKSLLKLVQTKDQENKTLRSKLSDLSSRKEKIESGLSRVKSDLSEANAQILAKDQDIAQLKKQVETVSREKTEVLKQLMKKTGSSDNVDLKIEKATEELQDKISNEVNELKRLLVKEIGEVKNQIQKSRSITSVHKDQRSEVREHNVQVAGEPKRIPTVVTDRQGPVHNQQPAGKKQSAFIAGDSMTRVLSSMKMSDSALGVKIKSHPGGKVKTIENSILTMNDKDPSFLKDFDAIILHVGTNNISDAAISEIIANDFREACHTIETDNNHIKIIVSSIIPRRNNRVVNEVIQKTNTSLRTLCQDNGYYFLDNTPNIVYRGAPDPSLYRDHIHLNTKGGKVLGTSMRTALNDVLNIDQSESVDDRNTSFHNGRYSGRRLYNNNNRNMAFMPVPQYYMNSQNPWFVPNPFWN